MIYGQQKGSTDSKENPLGQVVRKHQHNTKHINVIDR